MSLTLSTTPPSYRRRLARLALLLLLLPASCAFCVHDPINPQALEHNAFCGQYYREGKLTEAEARCRLAREFAPKYAEPVHLLGLIEYARGHTENAVERFKESIALKDDFAEAHNSLGAVLFDNRDYEHASDQFSEAIEIDPGYVSARVNLALCRIKEERYDSARAEYLKCMELEPKACDCRLGLGIVATRQNKIDEAKLQFQRMTEICPDNANGFNNLCSTYYQMRQCGSALEACMKALALKPDYIEARKTLTAATACLALEDGAVKEYIDKIRQNPGSADLHFNLGVVYAEKHLLEAALTEFLSAIKLNPDLLLAYYRAGRIFDEQIHAEDTIRMCKEFVDRLRNDKFGEQKAWCVQRVKELQYQ